MELRSFRELIGHEEIVHHLQKAIEGGTVAHAYIFAGESGTGKRTLASLFAASLLCETQGTDPCGACLSCSKVFSNNHPDLIYVQHEKPGVISVDEIREQVVGTADVRPYESRYKIYIIADAEKMNPQAQNALLKTIEEPAPYVVILLLATAAESLLPTIRSRCITLSLKPADKEKIRQYLVTDMHISTQEADIIAAFSQGNIGKARSLALGTDFSEMVASAVGILINIRKMSVRQAIAAVASLTQDKQNIYDYLDIFTMWFRDVLMFKATKDVDGLIFRGRLDAITEEARHCSYEGLEEIIAAIDTARNRLRANVNFEITMELLFLAIRER